VKLALESPEAAASKKGTGCHRTVGNKARRASTTHRGPHILEVLVPSTCGRVLVCCRPHTDHDGCAGAGTCLYGTCCVLNKVREFGVGGKVKLWDKRMPIKGQDP